jgi:hypothetical protein
LSLNKFCDYKVTRIEDRITTQLYIRGEITEVVLTGDCQQLCYRVDLPGSLKTYMRLQRRQIGHDQYKYTPIVIEKIEYV